MDARYVGRTKDNSLWKEGARDRAAGQFGRTQQRSGPAPLAKVLSYHYRIGMLALYLKYRQCGVKRGRVRAVDP